MLEDNQKALELEIKTHFGGDKRRIFFIARFLVSLVVVCSVSYSKLSHYLNPLVKWSSNFKRIQRFFKNYQFSQSAYINFVFSLLTRLGVKDRFVLAIDRTNWKYGEKNINILMIAILYRGTAIPLIWSLLDKQGNSNQKERIALIESLKQHTPLSYWSSISCITMDREFLGRKWLTFLDDLNWIYVLRARKSTRVKHKNKEIKIWQLFETDKYRVLRKKRSVFGLSVYLSGQKTIDKTGKIDYVIFVSNVSGPKVAVYYAQRWGIEVLFGDLKSRGFNFEDTHVTNMESTKTMIFLLAIAYLWAIKIGEWLIENVIDMPIRTVKGKTKKLYSIFKIGLIHLRIAIFSMANVTKLIRLLSCT